MRTVASVAKHPIHPMLVAIPIGLWTFSLVCDLLWVRDAGAGEIDWAFLAWYSIVGGIVGALVAAIPGTLDMLFLPWSLKRIALIHMVINLTVVALYVVNAWIRTQDRIDTGIWLSVAGMVLLAVSGWLGGRLVHVHGVSVEEPHEPATKRKEPTEQLTP